MEERPLDVDVIKAVRAPVAPAFVRAVVHSALANPEIAARLPGAASSVAVRITGDRTLRALNRTYAGIDAVTDVLSFEGDDGHLGDIAISWPAVVRQAREFGHSADTELALLAIHGLLHLLGWDHGAPAERREMWRLTRAALARSRIKLSRSRLA